MNAINIRTLALSGTVLVIGCFYDVNAIPRPSGAVHGDGFDAAAPDNAPAAEALQPELPGPEPPMADAGVPDVPAAEAPTETPIEKEGDTAPPDVLEAPATDGKIVWCNGVGHVPCAAGFFCDIFTGMCSDPDASGACVPRPTSLSECAKDTSGPVCSCSGEDWTNDCARIFAGRWKKWDGKCAVPAG